MTERPNEAPGDDLDLGASEPATQPPADDAPIEAASQAELAEEAPDLTDAELSAATEDAELEVEGEDGELDEGLAAEEVEANEELDAADEEADEDADEDAAVAAGAAAPLGARARVEQERARARARAEAARGGREPRATRTAFPIDPSLRIKDPTSAVFVAGTIVVFLLVFLNAMAFGHGGAFTPTHPPATPGPTVSAAPSGSPGASAGATSAPAATTPLQSGESAAP